MHRDSRQTYAILTSPLREAQPVTLPDGAPFRLDRLASLQLREEERREQFGWEPRRPDVHPRVLVHGATEELRPIGALLSDDLGARDEASVVEEDRAALPALDVLRLVEALSRHPAEAA